MEKKRAKDILQEILERYGFFDATIEETSEIRGDGHTVKGFLIHISEEDSSFLIGQYGKNLFALQHIFRLVSVKYADDVSSGMVILDVNNYRRKRDQSIVELARDVAREVEKTKNPITLRPMTGYERRLVHMELSKERNIVTESIGEGEERRILVRPLGVSL